MSKIPDIRDVETPPGSEIAVMQAFVRANAHSATSACSLETLGLAATPILKGLRARGFLYRASGDRWYLDMPRYLARRFQRRVLMVGASGLVIGLLVWFSVRAL